MRAPGALLLSPTALVALLTLVVNDQLLKRVCPGVLSGKLSDVAGMILFPLVLHAAAELAAARAGRPLSMRASFRTLTALVVATMLGFTLVELTAFGDTAYRVGLGALQWPFQAVLRLLTGSGLPSLRPVSATPDVTDLLALPFGLIALRLGHTKPSRARPLAASSVVLVAVVALRPELAHAAAPTDMPKDPGTERRHDGFFLDLDAGGGAFLVSSKATVSNGFRQPIASSAQGTAFPSLSIGVGGTLPRTSLVLGGRLSRAETSEPAIETLDHRFRLPLYRLAFTDFSAFARYYLNPHAGFFFGGGLGVLGLSAQTSADPFSDQGLPGGESQLGISLSPEVGQSFWLRNEISAGVTLRTLVAHTFGKQGGSNLFVPVLLASLTWN